MARIVLIHGAFNELWGPHELKARWVPCVQDGLWYHGRAIDPDDVAVCFYGDLYRLDPETLDLDEWKESRAGAADMMAQFGGEDALSFLSQAAGSAAYDRTIDMVTIMANDPDIRAKSRQRLVDLIAPDTEVVVGHSMGSIVAHQTLAANPQIELDSLITIGSPLGTDMIFPALEGERVDGVGPWPGGAQRWVNIAAHGDRAAGVHRLAEKFGDRVEDHLIDNGHRAHDPEPYLNSAVTGAAIARALEE
jgi:pimeloyl-ACP methyl ester carboxylesterase